MYVAWFSYVSFAHVPAATETQAALCPSAKGCITMARIRCLHWCLLDLSASLHGIDQQLLLTWALPLTVLQRITFLWFSFYALEKTAVFSLFLPLSRDETERTSVLKIYAASLLCTALSFKLFLPPTYLPFYCHPNIHASPSNITSVSCRIYLTVPE